MAPNLPMQINGKAWRDTVTMRLLNGYGVEDIAISMRCHVSHVRKFVAELRASGYLERMFQR